jgi:NAD(P)-dependent dehydrogenase (short-subunit alcohol dehydrogenase family)
MTAISLPRTPTFDLGGKRALVTGAGRGIGLGAAAALAQAGAHVTLCARSRDELDALRDAIRRDGGSADTLALDITDVAATIAALERCAPFDILVNNAGINRIAPFTQVGLDDFDAVFALNVKASYFVAQSMARRLMAAGRAGSIIQISSQLGHVGAAERSLYVASKFAVEGMVKALAVELGRAGIRVNAIAPTFIDTPLTRSYGLSEQALDAVRARIKLGRIGTIEDLMGAIVFLASDASALVTGTSLLVDGGWTAD